MKTGAVGLPVESFAGEHTKGGDDRQLFNLVTHGATLKMPNSYKKLKSAHLKLYSQLQAEQSEEDPSREFLEHLESTFDACGFEITHANIESESKKLLQEHYELHQTIESVAIQSADTDETNSWQEVYSCYCSWQFVLTKFKELQKRTRQLLEGWLI